MKTLHPKIHGGILADRSNPDHLADLERHGHRRPSTWWWPTSTRSPADPRHRADRHRRARPWCGPRPRTTPTSASWSTPPPTATSWPSCGPTARCPTPPGGAWPGPPSPTPRPTTPPSWPGSTRRTARADPLPSTLQPGRSSGSRTSATARTPTRWGPATGRRGSGAGGTTPPSTAARSCRYLNLYDAEAAWRLVHELGDGPAAVVIKHANPCGAAVADDLDHRLPAGPRVRPGLGLRRHRRRQPAAARRPGRGPGPRLHRGGDRPGVRGRRPRGPRRPRRTCGSSRPGRPPRRACRCARSTVASWSRPPTP